MVLAIMTRIWNSIFWRILARKLWTTTLVEDYRRAVIRSVSGSSIHRNKRVAIWQQQTTDSLCSVRSMQFSLNFFYSAVRIAAAVIIITLLCFRLTACAPHRPCSTCCWRVYFFFRWQAAAVTENFVRVLYLLFYSQTKYSMIDQLDI